MKPTQKLHQAGQSLWLDNITRELLTTGALRSYIDDLDHRADIEPDDLRSRLLELGRLRRRDPRGGRGGAGAGGRLLPAGDRDPPGRRRPVPAGLGPDERDRRVGVAGGVAAARPRPGEHAGGRVPALGDGRTAEPLHQDPRHPRGARCDRGGDLRRRAGERDPALQPRAVPRRGRRLHARRRAPGRGRARCGGGVGRVGVREPLGHLAGGEGRGRSASETRSASPRRSSATPPTASCSTAPLGRLANEGAQPQRLLWASTGTKDPEASDVLYVRAGGAPDGQHDAREDPPGLRRPRRGVRLPARRRGRRPAGDRPLHRRRRTSRRWPSASRPRGRPRSSRRGTSSCRPSRSVRQPSRADGEPAPGRAGLAGARGAPRRIGDLHLRDLFSEDLGRGERLVAEGAGLFLDYSKNRVTDETMALLVALAEERGLGERIEAMFRGERINVTEDRAVLHVALRAAGRLHRGRRRRRRPGGARGARPHGGVRGPRAARRVDGRAGSRSATSSTSASAGRTWGR